MKHIIFFALIACLFSCKKKEDEPTPQRRVNIIYSSEVAGFTIKINRAAVADVSGKINNLSVSVFSKKDQTASIISNNTGLKNIKVVYAGDTILNQSSNLPEFTVNFIVQ